MQAYRHLMAQADMPGAMDSSWRFTQNVLWHILQVCTLPQAAVYCAVISPMHNTPYCCGMCACRKCLCRAGAGLEQ